MYEWSAYSIVFLSGELTRRLEIDAKVRIVALIVFADIFYSVDMERHREPVHRQDDRLRFAIDEYL